ncbi:hypothetical protein [Actinomadura litoris]|nr:hypothetical protein [Actinomadura litoris]
MGDHKGPEDGQHSERYWRLRRRLEWIKFSAWAAWQVAKEALPSISK